SIAVNDVVRNNTFLGETGVASSLFVGDGISALTIQGNTFQDPDNSQNAIDISSSTTNIVIRDNTIRLTGAMGTTGIAIQGGSVVSAATAAGPVSARMNLFAVPNPETVIFDQADSGTLANVDASTPLTGNAAFVQALYLEFLHRAGNLANPNDAGNWVNMLNN